MASTLNETGRLKAVLMKHARDAFISQEAIDTQWRALNFTAPPDFARAVDEYDAFVEILVRSGAEISFLPRDDRLTLDSIYTRDASVICAAGVIACSMGKPQRRAEPAVQERELRNLSWPIAGRVGGSGLLEGGDLIWLDSRTLAVGQGLRTNAEGIRQLTAVLADSARAADPIAQLHVVPLPDWRGPQDVMHLMSLVSPVDVDLAVVHSKLLPPAFSRVLQDRGYRLVDVPEEEFESMGTNVLALAPRVCVMVQGNPKTRAALERAGAIVQEYGGREISLKGGGGPTCLTRPLIR
jgi:N-dimethylarginine dimethylaminohydrolase